MSEDITKIYIAGPMRGYEDFNFPAFYEAEDYARWLFVGDVIVFNPAARESLRKLKKKGPKPIAEYMKVDLPEVCECDELWLLPGWGKSQGATIELEVAKRLGKKIYTYNPAADRGARLMPFGKSEAAIDFSSEDITVTFSTADAGEFGPSPAEDGQSIYWKPSIFENRFSFSLPQGESDHLAALRRASEDESRHPSSRRFLRVVLEAIELHELKQKDYGTTDDPFANIRSSTGYGVPAWVGSEIRCHDKVTRIKSFLLKGWLANESLRDSLRDKAVYSLISWALYDEEQEETPLPFDETQVAES